MIAQHSGILAMALVFVVSSCCCCGGFDTTQIEGLLGGDVEQMLEEQMPDVAELLEPTATAGQAEAGEPASPEEAVQAAEEAEAAAGAAQATAQAAAEAVESGEPPAPPASDVPDLSELPNDLEQELDGLLGELEDQLGEGQIPDMNFDCNDVNFPLPDDMTECVSVAGFTSISTNMGQAEVDKLYDDYFMGLGWEHFPMMVQQGEVLNAWQSPDQQQYALLTFLPGEGLDGTNMIGLAMVGSQ